jgi:hypothetical protein
MSAGTIAALIVAVAVVVALVLAAVAAARRRKLQLRFGSEYDRLVSEHHSQRKARAELADRERRVQGLGIRPLSAASRAGYATQWMVVQQQFVDEPGQAVGKGQLLVVAVMNERGYPTEDPEQMVADLSVGHANALDHYRSARGISADAAAGTASTEDLRQAMIHYREMFGELLGERVGTRDALPSAHSTDPVAAQGAAAERVAAPAVAAPPAVPETAVPANGTADVRGESASQQSEEPIQPTQRR